MSGSMVNVGMQVWVRLMRGELTVRSVISGLEGLTSLWVTRTKPDQVKPELVAARATRPPSCTNRRPWATPASHITWLLLDGTPLASDLGPAPWDGSRRASAASQAFQLPPPPADDAKTMSWLHTKLVRSVLHSCRSFSSSSPSRFSSASHAATKALAHRRTFATSALFWGSAFAVTAGLTLSSTVYLDAEAPTAEESRGQ